MASVRAAARRVSRSAAFADGRRDEARRRRSDETTRDKSKLMSFKEKQQIKKVNRHGQRTEKAAI
jgi:hypothetical protein